MLKTRITEQYGLKVPIINAGMAFIATTPLVRAVCNAGGMGMLGIAAMPPDVLQAAIRDVKAVDPACFGVDIIARFSGIEHIEVCVREKVPVVVFFWDDAPDEWLLRLRTAGSHIWFQVGSVEEAKAALRHGAQGLVVQGSEAGGHNRAAAATFSLLPAVIDAVPSMPVVAAGGIADGRTLALDRDSSTRELRGLCPSAVQGPGRRGRRRGYYSPSDLWSGIPGCFDSRVAQPHRTGMGTA
jgi:enoyl-[acyl-carrier protein] reductase II